MSSIVPFAATSFYRIADRRHRLVCGRGAKPLSHRHRDCGRRGAVAHVRSHAGRFASGGSWWQRR
jgi:hypothetical protein